MTDSTQPQPLTADAMYAAVRPEFRNDGPGADKGDSDRRAHQAAERILDRLVASRAARTADPGGLPRHMPVICCRAHALASETTAPDPEP